MPLRCDNDLQPTTNFLTEVSKGLVVGHALVGKTGLLPSLNNGQTGTIWSGGGTFVFPTSVAPFIAQSTNAADAAAGTGARTLRIWGMDTNYLPITETVTLNGTTPVSTVQSFRRINECVVLAAGSGGWNVGTLTGSIGGTTVVHILPGKNIVQRCVISVPRGKTAYLLQVMANGFPNSGAGGYLQVDFIAKRDGDAAYIPDTFLLAGTGNPTTRQYESPLRFEPETDIYVQATSLGNNMRVLARFAMLFVDN